MPDDPNAREPQGLKKRVDELEAAVKALLRGMQHIETEQDETYMPKGTHYGFKFE